MKQALAGLIGGLRGVEVALAVRPEVALIDIGLPRLDGYAVASRVRAAVAGFDAHLAKPVAMEELQGILARQLPRS